MALANKGLQKVGSTSTQTDVASGNTQVCLVKPATALANPGANPGNDPSWYSRYQQYVQSVQHEPKYSQDWE
jgi:hypothetical protein